MQAMDRIFVDLPADDILNIQDVIDGDDDHIDGDMMLGTHDARPTTSAAVKTNDGDQFNCADVDLASRLFQINDNDSRLHGDVPLTTVLHGVRPNTQAAAEIYEVDSELHTDDVPTADDGVSMSDGDVSMANLPDELDDSDIISVIPEKPPYPIPMTSKIEIFDNQVDDYQFGEPSNSSNIESGAFSSIHGAAYDSTIDDTMLYGMQQYNVPIHHEQQAIFSPPLRKVPTHFRLLDPHLFMRLSAEPENVDTEMSAVDQLLQIMHLHFPGEFIQVAECFPLIRADAFCFAEV